MNLGETNAADYAAIFQERGSQYHAAMSLAPKARDAEFRQLFARYPWQQDERIIDAPSGGAYLQDFLQRSAAASKQAMMNRMANLEFTPGFSARPLIVDPYGPWPINTDWADRSICLAASHHITDLQRLLANFEQHTRPGGLVQLADVEPGSGIATFLDTFVDAHTSTGHRGVYRRFEDFSWPTWLTIQCIETRQCAWRFQSEDQLLMFCHGLFGLEPSAKPLIRQALAEHVGISTSSEGVQLQWQLVYVDGIKKGS